MGGGGCPTGYNSLGQPTGQPRELVEGTATQQIIIWAANQSAMEFVEGQPPYKIISGGGCPTGYNSLGQPRELVEWAAAQHIIIRAADPSAMKFIEWQPPYRSAMGGGGCPTGYNSLGQPRELVEWAAAQHNYSGSRPVSHEIHRMAAALQISNGRGRLPNRI